MNRLALPLIAVCALVAWLSLPTPAAAQYRRGGFERISTYHPEHMPGWDWRRTYPWSPYNYGRNPYNPVVVPYPVYNPVPYPVYPPPIVPTGSSASYVATPPDGSMFPNSQGAPVQIPQPTGVTSTPPADAALVLVTVPNRFAQVRFNGERTYTEGTTRYFVTPNLQAGRTYTYTVSAAITRNGAPVDVERQVKVTRGHTTVVDFTRPTQK